MVFLLFTWIYKRQKVSGESGLWLKIWMAMFFNLLNRADAPAKAAPRHCFGDKMIGVRKNSALI
jgi:hypothetical protein